MRTSIGFALALALATAGIAPASRLANSGMDASETLPLVIGAVVLLILGGIVLVIVRARARRK